MEAVELSRRCDEILLHNVKVGLTSLIGREQWYRYVSASESSQVSVRSHTPTRSGR